MLIAEKIAAYVCVQIEQSPFLWGSGGQGKSTFIRQGFGPHGYHTLTLRANTLLPHQIHGNQVADLERGTTRHLPPEWVAKLNSHPKSILFLDDISCAAPSIQTACLNLLDEKQFGELTMNAIPICAANPNAVGTPRFEMDATVSNRAIHINITSNADAFRADTLNKFSAPPIPTLHQHWKIKEARYMDLVTRFLCADGNGEFVNKMPDKVERASVAWPSERTWNKFWLILAACDAIDPLSLSGVSLGELKKLLLEGCVGKPAYEQFKKYFSKPLKVKVEDALNNSTNFSLPKEGDEVIGLFNALEDHFSTVDNRTEQKWQKAWKVAKSGWNSEQHRDRSVPFILHLASLATGKLALPPFYTEEVMNALELQVKEVA